MSKILTLKATVQIPQVPNFLRTSNETVLPLSAFDDDEFRAIAAEWTVNLLARAAELRKVAKEKE